MIIIDSAGGNVQAFEQIAEDLNRRGELLVIDGVCRSACTIMADRTRRVCITARAVFRFHWFRWNSTGQQFDPTYQYSERMQLLIRTSIGRIGREYRSVPNDFLRAQYRMCTEEEIRNGK